jgi:thioredoxin-dependent peroxiredoxin
VPAKTKPAKVASTRKTSDKAKPKASKPASAKGGAKVVPGPQPGDKAPDFKLQDDTGKTVSLADFRGKKIVLYFYPKDMTTGCTIESCDFRDHLPKLTKSGAVVLGVSADSVDSHRKFKEKEKLNFPLISDPSRKALEAYGVWQEKSLYGRKFMGIVRTTFVIDGEGKVAKVFPKVKVDGHVAEVLASL